MIYFDLKSDSEYLTVCRGKKRNKAFTNLCILFLDFQKIICGVSVIIFALQKTVHVDTRFSTDTELIAACFYLEQPITAEWVTWRACGLAPGPWGVIQVMVWLLVTQYCYIRPNPMYSCVHTGNK